MRSGIPPEEFFKIMKKKAALQAILDNLDQYTADDLENIFGQPLWIREILVKMKTGMLESTTREKANASAESLADGMTKYNTKLQSAPKHEIRKWIGGSWLMPCGMTGGMSIEINPDDLFIVMDPQSHFITISSSYSTLSSQHWNYFLQNTQISGIMTRSEYAKLVSDQLSKNFTDHNAIAKIAGPSSYVEPNSNTGFTIIRHPVK